MRTRVLWGIVLFMCASYSETFAGTFYSFKAGDFSDRNNWSTSSSGAQVVPSAAAWGSNSGWDNVLTISHAMTLSGGSYTQWGSTTSITINSGGSLKRTGALSLTGSGVKIIVNNGGVFETTGTLTLDGCIITSSSGASISTGGVSLSNSTSSSITNGGSWTVTGSVSMSGPLTNTGTLSVTVDYTQQNSGKSTVSSGTFNVTRDVFAYGLIQLDPGASSSSTMTIGRNLTVNDNPWIIVGTNVSSCNTVITYYANLIVKGTLTLTGSGDVTVNQSGRLVVYSNLTKSGGSGNIVTINCGGQVYVGGNIDLGTGGGNTVTNSNGGGSPTGSNGSPVIGLYVHGTVSAQNVSGSVGNDSDLQSNNSNFFSYVANLSGSPLPVELLFFSGSQSNNDVVLRWATASQLDFDYFSVEHSTDGAIWKEIDQVKGEGTTYELLRYELTTSQFIDGKNYYRLKSVDFDLSYDYSDVVVVEAIKERAFSIFPNPSRSGDQLSLELNFAPQDGDVALIVDNTGDIVARVYVVNFKGELDIPQLKPGSYIVRYQGVNFTSAIRLIIQ